MTDDHAAFRHIDWSARDWGGKLQNILSSKMITKMFSPQMVSMDSIDLRTFSEQLKEQQWPQSKKMFVVEFCSF